MFQRVTEFHRVFNQPVASSPELPDPKIRTLRQNLLKEEFDEFCNAYKANDLIEMADGLADMCYIMAGTSVTYGIAPEGTFESPYENVLVKLDLFLHSHLDHLLQQDFDKYMQAEANDDLDAIKDSLKWMFASIFGISLHLGIPINKVFAEVHRSNMAKVMPDGTVRYREDGKVLKPDTWTPPDIKSILDGVNKPKYD